MGLATAVVSCDPTDDGWRCSVTVGDDAGATSHEVIVGRATLQDLAPTATPELLVSESFAFLLEREPRESILRSFELPIIGRYFADYSDQIRRRLATG
ncbi:MAG TPA: hypothetical protein VLA76_01645 [Candidatus Angelobacter sp.]|nr:hypothetical protein [Candidatus Angelobacter sp.]